jgi:hypothetical protein
MGGIVKARFSGVDDVQDVMGYALHLAQQRAARQH